MFLVYSRNTLAGGRRAVSWRGEIFGLNNTVFSLSPWNPGFGSRHMYMHTTWRDSVCAKTFRKVACLFYTWTFQSVYNYTAWANLTKFAVKRDLRIPSETLEKCAAIDLKLILNSVLPDLKNRIIVLEGFEGVRATFCTCLLERKRLMCGSVFGIWSESWAWPQILTKTLLTLNMHSAYTAESVH